MSVPCHEGPPATRGHFCSEPAVAGTTVSADGDCLPHAGNVFAFGHQNGADEIRARFVIELALHEDNYLDGSFLRQGTLFDAKPQIGARQATRCTATTTTHLSIRR